MNKQYKITIIEFNGEGESLTAQPRYEQTVETLNIRAVIEAVNAEPEDPKITIVPIRRRRVRSDRGKKRIRMAQEATQ